MPGTPLVIKSSNLSFAWGQALLRVLDQPIGKCSPLIVTISGFESELPPEDQNVRREVDRSLKAAACNSCDVSGMVIFPYKLWLGRKRLSCDEFCEVCVRDLYPRLVALDRRNHHGTYFTRMMAYEGVRNGTPIKINQVAEVVDRLKGDRHFRATGLQMTCFNPAQDHSRQTRLGFPCLQHVGVTYEGDDGIAVTGFYPTQHIFARAYGNYLGLGHLGRFLGFHSKQSLRRITCIATRPLLGSGIRKSSLASLRKVVESQMEAKNDGR